MQTTWNGWTLQYDVLGRGSEPVVLLPALGLSGTMWAPQIEHFAARYLLLPLETGGNVRFAAQGAPTLADLADGVIAILDAVGLDHAHLVGISMGGMIAQYTAAAHSSRIRSAAFVSTTTHYPEKARADLRLRAQTAEIDGMVGLVAAAMERWFSPGFLSTHPEVALGIEQNLLRADPGAYAAAARSVADVDTRDFLARISAPSLVIYGEGDTSIPPSAAEQLSAVPTARLKTVPQAGHLCTVEAPASCNQILADFWASQPDDDVWSNNLAW